MDVDAITMGIHNTVFSTVVGQSTSNYGGAFNAVTLGAITLDTITVTTVNAKATSAFPGGGRFLYSI